MRVADTIMQARQAEISRSFSRPAKRAFWPDFPGRCTSPAARRR